MNRDRALGTFLHCEQCGARHALDAGSGRRAGRPRFAPLRTCRRCRLLTGPECWSTQGRICAACAGERAESRALAASGARQGPAIQPPAAPAASVPAPESTAGGWSRPEWLTTKTIVALVSALGLGIAVPAAFWLAHPVSLPTGDVAQETRSAASQPANRVAGATPLLEAGSPAQPTVAPAGDPRVVVLERMVDTWVDDFGELRAHLVVVVANEGDAPAFLPTSATRYALLAADGTEVGSGTFAYAFPQVVPPAGRAWFVDTISATFLGPDEIQDVVADVRFEPARAEPGAPLEVRGVTVEPASDGIVVAGEVANPRSEPVRNGVVGVLLRDAAGDLLAGVYDPSAVAVIEPGSTAAFRTSYPTTPAIQVDEVAEFEAVAVDYQADP